MTTRSCPKCGQTMVLVRSPYIYKDYWFCVNCWHMQEQAVGYRVQVSDNTVVNGNDNTKDWRRK